MAATRTGPDRTGIDWYHENPAHPAAQHDEHAAGKTAPTRDGRP